jgi:hypothetical protein
MAPHGVSPRHLFALNNLARPLSSAPGFYLDLFGRPSSCQALLCDASYFGPGVRRDKAGIGYLHE